jgi:hypothetical protein
MLVSSFDLIFGSYCESFLRQSACGLVVVLFRRDRDSARDVPTFLNRRRVECSAHKFERVLLSSAEVP